MSFVAPSKPRHADPSRRSKRGPSSLAIALVLTTACSAAPAANEGASGVTGMQMNSAVGMPTAGVSGAPLGTGGAAGASMTVTTGGTGAIGAGTGGVAGMVAPITDAMVPDPNPDAGTDAAIVEPMREKPPCLTKGSQVVLLGDSYMNWVSHAFSTDLYQNAGQTYRMYAVGAWAMGSGGIGLIPTQLDQAVAADPDIIAAVITGGGNDVLVPSADYPMGAECRQSATSASIPDCQEIVRVAFEAARTLMHEAADAGVRDVVYYFYPHVPEGTLIGGAHPNAILDYSLPMVKDLCDTTEEETGGKLRCHFVDLIPIFEGHPEYFAPTDIHPSLVGSVAMADAVWETMQDNCIAQPASSGCCEP